MLKKLSVCIAYGLILSTLSACKTVELYSRASRGLERYERLEGHKAFFVVEEGNGGYAWATSYRASSRRIAYNRAATRCNEIASQLTGSACLPYMIDDIQVNHASKAEIEAILSAPRTTRAKRRSKAQPEDSRWVKLSGSWQGLNSDAGGRAEAMQDMAKAFMQLRIGAESCSGLMHADDKKTPGINSGTWKLTCTSDLTATGSFTYPGKGHGYAEGTDNLGRKIKLTIEPTAAVGS